MSHNIKNRTWPQSITWQCLVTEPEESERATALPVALKGWQQWWRPMIMNIRENMKMRKSGLPTNEIVELLPAPVDPTQMTHARGKERSLEKNIFKIAYIGSLSTCICLCLCLCLCICILTGNAHQNGPLLRHLDENLWARVLPTERKGDRSETSQPDIVSFQTLFVSSTCVL